MIFIHPFVLSLVEASRFVSAPCLVEASRFVLSLVEASRFVPFVASVSLARQTISIYLNHDFLDLGNFPDANSFKIRGHAEAIEACAPDSYREAYAPCKAHMPVVFAYRLGLPIAIGSACFDGAQHDPLF